MADKAWKRTERKIAALLGGKRVPITGRQRGDVPDVQHEWLSIEVKHRRTVPDWLLDAMAQAVAAVRGEQHGDDLVVLRLADFREWFGGDGLNSMENEE